MRRGSLGLIAGDQSPRVYSLFFLFRFPSPAAIFLKQYGGQSATDMVLNAVVEQTSV
jgi:hypothetical protein